MMSNEELFAFVKKNRLAVACGVLSVGLALAAYYRGDGLAENQAVLDQKAVEGRRLALNLKNAAQLDEQLAAVSAATAEIKPRLVRVDELANNLQYFYKLEAETGTRLSQLQQTANAASVARWTKTNPKAAFVPIGFSLSVEGEYPALLDFLRRLENGTHYARAVAASVNILKPDRSGPYVLQLNVELLGTP